MPTPAGVNISQTTANAVEGGATGSYTVVLNSLPTGDVTITLDNTNEQVTTNVATLSFTDANWNVPQTVTVTAVNDTVGEGTHYGALQHTVASTDSAYNGLAVAPVQIVITDNDLPTGSPHFQSPQLNPFALGGVGNDATPTLVDIDGDGDLDAFIGNLDGDTAFFRNTGSATQAAFATASANPFGLGDVSFSANPTFVDIDGDGDLDAFIGQILGDTLFFRNTGSATLAAFAASSANPFALGDVGNNATPTFVDIDADGDLDAFIGNSSGDTLFFRNTGSATQAAFATASANPFGLGGVGSLATPTFVDIDSDGDLDAFIGQRLGNTLFFRNTGSATLAAFAASSANPFGLGDVGYSAKPTFVDIDGDGDLDAFIGEGSGNTLFFLNAAGITLNQSALAVGEGGATASYTVVLNSPPTDNVTITLDNTNKQVTTNIATLTFTPGNWNTPQTVTVTAVDDTVGEGTHYGALQHTVTSADSAYDGLAVAPVQVVITDNDLPTGSQHFQSPQPNPFGLGDVGNYAKPTLVDIDGDGDLDAFIGNSSGDTLFFRNTGSATQAAFATVSINPFGLGNGGSSANPTLVDIDGDGDLDAFIGNTAGDTLFFRNTGSATQAAFATASVNPFGLENVGSFAAPTFVDIDGDGDLDAFIGNLDGDTLFLRNTGSATQAAFAAVSSNPFGLGDAGYFAKPTFVDIDSDGDLDAFIGEFNGNTLFFRNTGSATLAAFATASANPFGLGGVGYSAKPTFVDIDGDGDLDAFIGEKYGNTLFFLNAAGITLSQSPLTVGEGGATASYTVVLNSPPTDDVTITLDYTNKQVTTDATTLTFTPGNWNTPQTVTVTAVDDTVGEGTHYGALQHTVASTDNAYDGLAVVAPVQVVITDNDLPTVSPHFQSPQTNPFGLENVGSYAAPILVDIDGDGDLDAFIGNRNGDTAFFRNTGSATQAAFTASSANPFGLGNVGVSAAPTLVDIDGDGDLDAFIGNTAGNTLFFRNTGSATQAAFAAASANPFGLGDVGSLAKPTFADIDGDGDLDAFIGEVVGSTLFFRNTGSATHAAFEASSANPFGLGNVGLAAAPTFVDIDGDGDLDAIISQEFGKTMFFRNTGSATQAAFAAASVNPFGLGDVRMYPNPTLVDIDGDGDLDAFIGNSYGNTLFFLNAAGITLNQSALAVGESGATGSYTVVLNSPPTDDVTITLDNTNQQVTTDAATLTFTPGNWNTPQTVTVTAVNDTVGEGTHTGAIKHTASSSDTGYSGLAIATLQVAITDNDLPARDPVFKARQTNPFNLTDAGTSAKPSFADIDSDGDLDAFVGAALGDTLFFLNTGSASSAAFTAALTNPFNLINVGSYAAPTLADIDGDGDLDAFVGEQQGNTLFFLNTGSASSAAFAAALTNPFNLTGVGTSVKPTFADIDGDGDLDAFVGERYGNTLFFLNTGSAAGAAFAAAQTNPFNLTDVGSYAAPTLADIDGDGDLDALIGNRDGNTLFFLNTGSAAGAAFAAAQTNPFNLTNVGFYAAPTFADINGDGDLDALMGNRNGDTLFFLNDQPPTLTGFAAALDTTAEDTEVQITLAELKAQGDEADVDGSVDAFVIKSVTSGSLKIGADAASAQPWAAGSNDTVDAAHHAYWTPAANANGLLNAFTVVAKDNEGTESTPALQAQMSVTAVNDAPVNSLPASYTTAEDTAVKLSGLSVSDVDASIGVTDADRIINTVTLAVSSGTLAATSTGGITIIGSGSSSLQLRGSLVSINAYLADTANQPIYTPVPDANGTVVLTMTGNDGGDSGTGGAQTDTDSIDINITAVNDAPINTVPGAQSVDEDTNLVITGLSISDVDAALAIDLTTTLSVLNGTLTVTSAGGAAVSGSGSNSVTLTGSVDQINATLAAANNVVYKGVSGFNGSDTLTIVSNDQGHTGGDPLSDSDTVAITVSAVNEAPTAVDLTNTTTTLPENTNTTSRVKVADITVTDPDTRGTNTLSLTGADAASFEIEGNVLYLKAGVTLDYETQTAYAVTVNADDTSAGSTPDASRAFTLGVANLDEVVPVFTSGTTAAALNENSGASQVVYTATTTDNPDAGHPGDGPSTPLVYTLGGSDAALFSIDANSGAVTLTANPDFEAQPSYSFNVTATDAAGNAALQAVTLAVNNLDEVAPVFISGTTATALNENSGAGQVVYTATTTDNPDAGHPSDGPSTRTYSLGGSDAASFSINAGTGAVTLTGNPNFEAKPAYSFNVIATDAAGNVATQAVTLAVNNLDEVAPVFTSGTTATALDENSGAGQVVYTATTTDSPDVGHPGDGPSARTYSLGGTDAALFTINTGTGAVTLTGNPNFEAKPAYSFNVVATDAAGNAATQAVTLAVNNVDEVAPVFTSGTTATALDENSGAGQVVYTAVTTDNPDASHPNDGPSARTYSLSGTDAALFTIDAGTGVVTLTGNPNFETQPDYSFNVVATDAAGNAATQAVTLAVNNLDEVAPVFTSTSTIAIAENGATDQVVYTATTIDDPDAGHPSDGPSGRTYSLVAGGDAAAFTINASTGEVSLIDTLDYETKSEYSFTVLATDAAGNAASKAVTLIVNNVDEVAPVFSSGASADAIGENSGAGQIVYTAQATDAPDAGHPDDGPSLPLVYSLRASGDAAAFSIDPDSGEVTLTGDPNREAKSTYSFTVVATDAAGNSTEQGVTLAVNNLDEVAPVFTSAATAAINENSGAGQVVYTAQALDAPDAAHPLDGPSLPLTYSLAGTDAAAFSIDAGSGAVTLSDNPDFEGQPSYSIEVSATDSAGNATTQAVTLAVNNLDEVAPLFTSGATASALDENSGAGQVVYNALAGDAPDGTHPSDGPSTPLAYTLGGTDAAAFSIDASTGAVKLTGNPNFENQATYAFSVTATDTAGNATTQPVTLAINNLNEAPAFSSGATASVVENSPISTVVYTAVAADPDAGQTLTYSLGGSDADLLAINADSGAVTLKANPDFETKNSYSFTVTATDDGTDALSALQAVTLSVTNVLDEDGDGLPDTEENTVDVNGDGVIDSQDTDIDGDGLLNSNDPDADGDGLLDSVENGRDSDGDGLSDASETDDDNDGSATKIEQNVPALPNSGGTTVVGDGNGDGTPDSQQTNVLSREVLNTPTAVSDPGAALPVYVTLASDSDAGKVDTTGASASRITGFQQLDAPADFPNTGDIPLGLFSFSATTQTPGGSEHFSLYIDGDIAVNGYWKQDAAGTWVNLASAMYGGAVTTEGGKTRLDFSITDGDQFDSDHTANGVITDPGAAAFLPPIGRVINDTNKGNNVLGENGSNDMLLGNNGNDHLTGGSGDNWLVGGGGKDFYHYSGTDLVAGGIDRLVDSNGSAIVFDSALLSQLKLDGASLASLTGGKHVLGSVIDANNSLALKDGVLQIDVNGDGVFNADDDFQVPFFNRTSDTLNFNANKDLLLLGGKGAKAALPMTGSNQSDNLIGDNKANDLNGGGGDDKIYAAGGKDKLTGGTGADILVGGGGRDQYYWSAADLEANGHDQLIDGKGSRLSFDASVLSQLKLDGQTLSALTGHKTAIGSVLNGDNSVAYHDGVLQLDLNGNGSFDAGDFQIEIVGTSAIKGLVFDGALDVVKLI